MIILLRNISNKKGLLKIRSEIRPKYNLFKYNVKSKVL